MFKKMILIGALAGLAGLLILGAVNRTLAKTGREGGSGVSRGSPDADLAQTQTHIWSEGEALAGLPAVAPAELSEDEIAGLLFMGEEEKLAQDAYLAFYEMWGLPVFNNIAGSEATHTAAVKTLLDAYGLEDPVSSQAGVFSDTSLAALYSDLVSRGSVSLEEALKVALIEEIDILDLETWLAQTSNADIIRVYEN